ncbi:BLOC-1-related complex subunit 8-like protein [Bienertia sinuspersici]
MCELSAAEGFVEINENLGDMIKYVANEPSVGLYYIQQHAQNAVPNIIRLKNNISEKSHEVSLHTEDLDDSIAMTRTMKECGSPVIDDMIRDIKASLTIMATKQPVRGVIQQRSSSYQAGASTSWIPATWVGPTVGNQHDTERVGSYFSSVFKSAKEKAGNIKWTPGSQLDVKEPLASRSNGSSLAEGTDELPISIPVEDEVVEDMDKANDENSQLLLPEEREFDVFKADKEARLEEWLEGSGTVLQNESVEDEGR